MNKMFSTLLEKMKSQYLPTVDTVAKLTMDGQIAVNTNTPNGKEWIVVDSEDQATVYPEEMLLDMPLYTIAKTIDELKVGDIIKVTSSTYAKITEIKNGKVWSITFGGNCRSAKPIKDIFLNRATIPVVINFFAGTGANGFNNMLPLLLLSDKDKAGDNDNLMNLLLFSGMAGAGANGVNPLSTITANPMLLMLLGKNNDNMEDLLLMSALGGGISPFAGMFGKPTVVNTKEESKKAEEKPKSKPVKESK